MFRSTWGTRRKWELADSWPCVAFYRLGGIRWVGPNAFVVRTTASDLSDRCSGGYGSHPAELSVSAITGVWEKITYLLHVHPRKLFLKVRNVIGDTIQRVARLRPYTTGTKTIALWKDVGETTIIAESFSSDLSYLMTARDEALTRFCIYPMGRRDTPAFSRRKNSFVHLAFGSQARSVEYGHPQSPLRQDGKGVGSEAKTRRSESEGDTRRQMEQGMEEQDPVEHWLGNVGADPVGQGVVVGPDAGEGPAPSQEPVLGGVGTDQEEPVRSLLAHVRESW